MYNISMSTLFLISLIILLSLFLMLRQAREEIVGNFKVVLARTVMKNAPKEDPKPVSHGHGHGHHDSHH